MTTRSAPRRPRASGRRCGSGCGFTRRSRSAHIVGIALLFGSIAVLDLRLLGFSQKHPGAAPCAARAAMERRELPAHRAERLADVHGARHRFHLEPGVRHQDVPHHGRGRERGAFPQRSCFRSVDVWDSEEMRRLPPPPSARLGGRFAADLDLGDRLRAIAGVLLETRCAALARRARPGCRPRRPRCVRRAWHCRTPTGSARRISRGGSEASLSSADGDSVSGNCRPSRARCGSRRRWCARCARAPSASGGSIS